MDKSKLLSVALSIGTAIQYLKIGNDTLDSVTGNDPLELALTFQQGKFSMPVDGLTEIMSTLLQFKEQLESYTKLGLDSDSVNKWNAIDVSCFGHDMVPLEHSEKVKQFVLPILEKLPYGTLYNHVWPLCPQFLKDLQDDPEYVSSGIFGTDALQYVKDVIDLPLLKSLNYAEFQWINREIFYDFDVEDDFIGHEFDLPAEFTNDTMVHFVKERLATHIILVLLYHMKKS